MAEDSFEDASAARAFLRKFLVKKEGSVLRAWLQRLDPECERLVTEQKFMRYMRDAKCPAEAVILFEKLDEDGGGELSLQELDEVEATLFHDFQEFCVAKFRRGIEDFMRNIGECNAWDPIDEVTITFEQFRDALQRLGWCEGQEDLLFDAMSADKQLLTSENMKWLGVEVRRSLRKEKARQAAFQEQRLQERRVKYNPSKTLLEFKQMLKKKFGGSLVRAWRAAFCTRNTMSMQKPQFLKACAELGWRKDVRAMWYLLDKDANGCVTVEEFDYENAQALARFHKYILQHFRSVETAFKVLDVDRNLYVPKEEFEAAAGRMGFEPAVAEQIYAALDLKAMGKIFEEDMRFLDTWKPRAFLTAEANHAAADQVKSRLLKKYGSFLRAWRLCLDKSSNNMCSWEEFRDACKEVGCQEDAPGAWVALESRRAGSLTLQDVDPTAGEALAEFRDWAVEQFGSVKTCFTVLDDDGSNEVTPFEFKQACRAYGFKGAAKLAFKALDTNGRGILSTDDISFLDEWTGSEPGLEEPMDAGLAEDALDASRAPSKSSRPQALPDMVKLVDELDWQEGALHPAFRMWANRKRKKPVRKPDGSLPPLLAQVDFGDPHLAKRPVLLLAPVPLHARDKEARARRARRQKPKPGLDTLLNFRSPRIDRSYRNI